MTLPRTPSVRLDGRRALVAGASSGIGLGCAAALAEAGAVYAASKHAVEGRTKSMAIEWGPHGIRVNTVCPTFIRTPLTEATFANPERAAWIAEKIKLPRIGEVEDIMGAVVFLASDAAALITGTALMVDGGWTAD